MPASAARQITENAYNPTKEAGPFNPVPRIISRRLDLSWGAKAVYGYLAGCYGHDGVICPRVSHIAFELGIGERQVGRCLDELRQKNLITSIRTGRASYYQFVPLNDAAGRSARPCISDKTPTTYQDDPAPLLENKKEKATASVVVFPDADAIKQATAAVRPDVPQTKSIRRTIRQGIADHGLDAVLKAIDYTNHHSTRSYGAYLARTIAESWAEEWTPMLSAPPQQDPAIIASEEARQAAALKAEQAELIEARAEAARKYREMTKSEKSKVRERFLVEANRFTRRKCERLDLDVLGASLPFLIWFSTSVTRRF